MQRTFERYGCIGLSVTFVAVLAILGFVSPVCAQDGEVFNENAPLVTKAQQRRIRNLNREMRAKVEPLAKRDPRYAPYLQDFEELKQIADETEFVKKSEEFKQKYEKFNDDVLRKAGVSIKTYNLRLKQILPRIKLNKQGMILQTSEVSQVDSYNNINDQDIWYSNTSHNPYADTTAIFTGFPNTTTFKDCNQGKLTFADAKSLESFSKTSIDDNDCTDVKAARGVIFKVFPQNKKIAVEIELNKSDLRTLVSCYGFFGYAYAYSSVGIRLKKRGTSLPAQFIRFQHVESAWSVFGKTGATRTETGIVMSGTFNSSGEGDYDVQAYVRTVVDTDGFALVFFSTSEIAGMSKMTVTRKDK